MACELNWSRSLICCSVLCISARALPLVTRGSIPLHSHCHSPPRGVQVSRYFLSVVLLGLFWTLHCCVQSSFNPRTLLLPISFCFMLLTFTRQTLLKLLFRYQLKLILSAGDQAGITSRFTETTRYISVTSKLWHKNSSLLSHKNSYGGLVSYCATYPHTLIQFQTHIK